MPHFGCFCAGDRCDYSCGFLSGGGNGAAQGDAGEEVEERHRGDYLQVFVGGVVTQASDFAAGVVQGYPFVIKKIFDEVEPE